MECRVRHFFLLSLNFWKADFILLYGSSYHWTHSLKLHFKTLIIKSNFQYSMPLNSISIWKLFNRPLFSKASNNSLLCSWAIYAFFTFISLTTELHSDNCIYNGNKSLVLIKFATSWDYSLTCDPLCEYQMAFFGF